MWVQVRKGALCARTSCLHCWVVVKIKKSWWLESVIFVQNMIGGLKSSIVKELIEKFKDTGSVNQLDTLTVLQQKHERRAWENCRESRNMSSAPWSVIGHFEKPATAYSLQRFASPGLLRSIYLRTEDNWPCTAKRVTWIENGTTRIECWFFKQTHFQQWGSLSFRSLRSSTKFSEFEVQKIFE